MEAFEDVYRRHLPALFRYAVRTVGRRDVAEDLVSEAFTALWRTFDTIDTSQLPSWLFTVVRNRATDYWRRSALEQRYLAGMDADPIARETRSEFQGWLDSAPALKPIHRAALILRYVHGCDRAEIARRMGLTDTQVKGHLQYAHQLLRKGLKEDE